MAKIAAKIGKYTVVSQIAKGGMSAVYKGKHPTLNRFIILKKLTLRGRSSIAERFKREARLMMDFKNDYIAQVYDHFKEGASYYIVEEYVDGIALDALIKRERYLPSDLALLIFRDCCRALKYAHDKSVVHRDIKPGNILISRDGEVKLVDFGIATGEEDDEAALTREGMTLGTPSYMSPEQIENTKNVDKRADIYSMGVMLYEMVTGKTPFPGSFTPETIALIQKGKYKPVRKANPKVSSTVSRIIKKAMQSKSRKRYQDLEEVFNILNRSLKKKDRSAGRREIRSYINKEQLKDIKKKRKPRLKSVLFAALLLLFVLTAGSAFIYYRGYYYEFFHSEEYGALVVSAKVNKEFKEPGESSIRAVLYQERDNANTRLDDMVFTFGENREKETEQYFFLESQKVYLKTDQYRIKVSLDNKLLWETFFLDPRKIQKGSVATFEARIVEVAIEEIPPLPLTVQYKVLNQADGRDITAGTDFYVLVGSKWTRWNRRLAGSLTTGKIYKFKFESRGYYPREYHLIIKQYQSVLDFQVTLIPHPGSLRVSSNHEGIKILLDNSQFYLSGGENPSYKKLAASLKGTQEIVLSPGEYLLTAEVTPSITRETKVRVESGQKVEVDLDFNRDSKTLNLKVGE